MDRKPSFEDIVDDLNRLIRMLIESMPAEGLDETVVYGFSIIKRGDEEPIIRKMLPEDEFDEIDDEDLGSGMIEPHIETIEGDDEVYITAEVPNIREEDIEVDVGERVVRITAVSNGGSCSLMSELPCAVDASLAKISYRNGVLEVVLPKQRHPRTGYDSNAP